MTEEIKKIVLKIDSEIRQHEWFDFHVLNFDAFKLTVAGSVDLTYYHKLEIIFEDIFFVSGFFQGWHSDTKQRTFLLPDNEKEMNEKYEIEQGYQLFIFRTEDYTNDVLIAAKNISFNTDTVYYYERTDLKENERIADFVKKKNVL
jgi:hypothetical protein